MYLNFVKPSANSVGIWLNFCTPSFSLCYHEFLLHLSYEVSVVFLNSVLGDQIFFYNLQIEDLKGF